jgi:hypothetical protein
MLVDAARLFTIALCIAVAVVYTLTALQIASLLLKQKLWTAFVRNLNLGRMLGCVGTAIMALTVLEGHIVRWGDPLSVRVPLTVLAAVALIWGWYHSSRFVFRAQITPPEERNAHRLD